MVWGLTSRIPFLALLLVEPSINPSMILTRPFGSRTSLHKDCIGKQLRQWR